MRRDLAPVERRPRGLKASYGASLRGPKGVQAGVRAKKVLVEARAFRPVMSRKMRRALAPVDGRSGLESNA